MEKTRTISLTLQLSTTQKKIDLLRLKFTIRLETMDTNKMHNSIIQILWTTQNGIIIEKWIRIENQY